MNWKDLIKEEKKKSYFKKLSEFIISDSKQYRIYPNSKDIFNAFKYFDLNNTKVLILGMDPYHQPNQAHGLAFSVLNPTLPPPSLKNIYKEIKSDCGIECDNLNGNLEPWAKQGVLLLNSFLSVREGQPGSHSKIGWEIFTDRIISELNNINNIVFMLWGNHAKSKIKLLTNKNNLILTAAHPSPLSAHNGFFGCKHFSKANEFLKQQINWKI